MNKGWARIQGNYRGMVWRIALGVLLLKLVPAEATLTSISTSNEPSVAEAGGILDQLYGLENLTRVEDSGSASPVDQYWTLTGEKASVTGQAKYAGFPLQFGILSGQEGWDYDILITTGANKQGIYGETNGMSIQSVTNGVSDSEVSDIFRLGLQLTSKNGYIWSSVPTDNLTMPGGFASDGMDHMVTWQITGNTGHANNRIGNYVVAWEDLDTTGRIGKCDSDYNDLVVEISGAVPIPEPGSMSLLACLGLLYLRNRRKKP